MLYTCFITILFLELILKICVFSKFLLFLLLYVQLHKYFIPAINPLKQKKNPKGLMICFVSVTGGRAQQKSVPVVLADEVKNPAMEKLELVRKWSLNTYKVCRRIFVCERVF